jgi:hypothetical protein
VGYSGTEGARVWKADGLRTMEIGLEIDEKEMEASSPPLGDGGQEEVALDWRRDMRRSGSWGWSVLESWKASEGRISYCSLSWAIVSGDSLGSALISSQLKNSVGEEVREGVPGARCIGVGRAEIGVWGCFQTITSSSSAKGNESLDESCARDTAGSRPSKVNTASSTATGGTYKATSQYIIQYNRDKEYKKH